MFYKRLTVIKISHSVIKIIKISHIVKTYCLRISYEEHAYPNINIFLSVYFAQKLLSHKWKWMKFACASRNFSGVYLINNKERNWLETVENYSRIALSNSQSQYENL